MLPYSRDVFHITETTATFMQSRAGIGDKEHIHIIGIPLEDTTSFRQGTKYAPTILRQLSPYVEATTSALKNIDNRIIRDIGDIALLQGSISENVKRIRETIAYLLEQDIRKLVIIGGEHTITYASSMGIAGDTLLIVADAHLDMRDEWPPGQKLSHATHLRRLIEDRKNVYIIHVGARSFDNEEITFLEDYKDRILLINRNALKEINRGILIKIMRDFISTFSNSIDTMYISVDLDVLDISYMAAVSNPEGSGGLCYDDLIELLRTFRMTVKREPRRVICDIVEYCPSFDPGFTYGTVAVKTILDLMEIFLLGFNSLC